MVQEVARNAVYSPKWQQIRIMCKGKWVKNTDYCVDMMRAYLGDMTDYTRLWRVLNNLNATRMGFHGMKLIGTEADQKLVALQEEVANAYKYLKDTGAEIEIVTDEVALQEWAEVPKVIQDEIINDLMMRWIKAGRPKTRGDLRHFLKLIGAI